MPLLSSFLYNAQYILLILFLPIKLVFLSRATAIFLLVVVTAVGAAGGVGAIFAIFRSCGALAAYTDAFAGPLLSFE